MRYEYYFVGYGEIRKEYTEINNEIWLDVGNVLGPGSFDHHHFSDKYESTVDILTKELDLLEKTAVEINRNEVVRIYFHVQPDLDAIGSLYYLKDYLENGREFFEEKYFKNPAGQKLTQFLNDIDDGKKKIISDTTMYCLHVSLYCEEIKKLWGKKDNNGLYTNIINQTLNWIDNAYLMLENNPEFDIYHNPLPVDDGPEVEIIRNRIKKSLELYSRDKEENRLIIANTQAWTKSREIVEVRSAVWNDIPLSPETAYIYAREEGADITFVPHKAGDGLGVIVAVNPDSPKAADLSLIELAEFYEELEQVIENKNFAETGRYRRDYSRPRVVNSSTSIFLKRPFRITSDPWYVSENGDILDSPRVGTLIDLDRLIEMFMHYTCMVKNTFIYYIDLGLNDTSVSRKLRVDHNPYQSSKDSMWNWIQSMTKVISFEGDNKYKVIVAEIDSALIAHDFNILDAYYATLINENISDIADDDRLRIDYRTHLYVNQAFSVLFVATYDNQEESEYITQDKFVKSPIVDAFCKILYQREKYKDMGRFIGTKDKSSAQIRQYSEELVKVLSVAQADECIDKQIELDIYNFIYQRMNMSVLRDNITESMNRVSENKKDSFFRNIDRLSIISVPFILASTIFQMGMVTFKPLIDTSEEAAISPAIPWVVYLSMMLGITLVYIFGGKRKK